uniref:ATP synthase F0 subunit 8 n=1 Tax=Acrobeloides nanus TaxID=290746 RepID=A0A914EAM8_9BILA
MPSEIISPQSKNESFVEECHCNANYMTPWATVIAMLALYLLLLFWFCKHGKKLCLPAPDSIYPYKRRLRYLKRVQCWTRFLLMTCLLS